MNRASRRPRASRPSDADGPAGDCSARGSRSAKSQLCSADQRNWTRSIAGIVNHFVNSRVDFEFLCDARIRNLIRMRTFTPVYDCILSCESFSLKALGRYIRTSSRAPTDKIKCRDVR